MKMETTNAEPLPLAVDAGHLARLLCVSVRTIRSMDSAGKLPQPIRLNGRSVRWAICGPNGIRAWLAAGAPDRATWSVVMEGSRHD